MSLGSVMARCICCDLYRLTVGTVCRISFKHSRIVYNNFKHSQSSQRFPPHITPDPIITLQMSTQTACLVTFHRQASRQAH